jgi:hypothetical protein
MDWPGTWPDRTRDNYSRLAQQWKWSEYVVQGVIENVEYLRELTESDAPRRYFRGVDSDEIWAFETAAGEGKQVVVRQVQILGNGQSRPYWWEWREDDEGSMTDQPIRGDEERLAEITANEFDDLWKQATS